MGQVLYGETLARASVPRRKLKTIGHADLTAAAVAQNIAIDDLPAYAQVIGWDNVSITAFSGGGSGSCTMSIGTAAAPTLIMAATSVFTGVAAQTKGTAGVSPDAYFPSGASLIARFTADVNVALLDAGAITIAILYVVPADV